MDLKEVRMPFCDVLGRITQVWACVISKKHRETAPYEHWSRWPRETRPRNFARRAAGRLSWRRPTNTGCQLKHSEFHFGRSRASQRASSKLTNFFMGLDEEGMKHNIPNLRLANHSPTCFASLHFHIASLIQGKP